MPFLPLSGSSQKIRISLIVIRISYINPGVDVFALKNPLGHRKMETTMIYAKAEFGYKKKEMDKWEIENI